MRRHGEDFSLAQLCQEVSGVLNQVRTAFGYTPMKGVAGRWRLTRRPGWQR